MSAHSGDGDTSMEEPVFSILVPSFNTVEFIAEALQSAIDQMGPNDELLIQDGGSSDGTLEIIRSFEGRDGRVRVVTGPDKGQSDALNLALARAKPSWIVWLNSDDVLLPGALQALREAILSNSEADVFFGGSRILRLDGSSVEFFPGRPMVTDKLLRQGITSFSGSIVMRDHLLRELGGIQTDLQCAMDYDLQMRIAARHDLKQVNVPVGIGALRFHESSKSANQWKGFIRESHRVRMKYSHSAAEKARGLWGTAWHVVEVPFFRLRLSPTYRRLRRKLPAELR